MVIIFTTFFLWFSYLKIYIYLLFVHAVHCYINSIHFYIYLKSFLPIFYFCDLIASLIFTLLRVFYWSLKALCTFYIFFLHLVEHLVTLYFLTLHEFILFKKFFQLSIYTLHALNFGAFLLSNLYCATWQHIALLVICLHARNLLGLPLSTFNLRFLKNVPYYYSSLSLIPGLISR